MAEPAVENQERHNEMLVRRAAIRDYVESRYGEPTTRRDILAHLETLDLGTTYPTLRNDLRKLGIEEISTVVGGSKIKFFAAVSYVPEISDEALRQVIDQDVLETESYRALNYFVVDVFLDGKRVIIQTTYHGAKPLALFLRNLNWPEIWYFIRDDADTIIIETRSPQRAEFLRRRIWGFSEDFKPDQRFSWRRYKGQGDDDE